MRSSRFGMVSKCVFALLTQWAKKGKKYPFYVVKIPVSKNQSIFSKTTI